MIAIKKLRKRSAVSPVIATVILVAVTITVAVAVSYWMSGIASQYTSFEKVEIKSAYASRKYDASTPPVFKGWVIEIGIQNTGSSVSTLESLFINDRPISEYGICTPVATTVNKIRWLGSDSVATPNDWPTWEGLTTDVASVSLESGDESKVYILIYGDKVTLTLDPDGIPANGDEVAEGLFSAGTTLNVKFHSANGMDYIKLVQLT